ncbi:hypothetical protein BDW59DRAFT_155640 [Aspergillus cavernicola]|uniref:Heterokaryon incompatibility domain-containing protein n=1 Tax=Aspergillus cavernicola TaxID=176166 RepID=A0ABR4H3Z0_9EURO
MRYKIKVMRNSFLWLDDILGETSWSELFTGYMEQPHEISTEITRRQIICLTTECTRRFWVGKNPLDNNDFLKLNGLWTFFHDNSQIPIKHAFCLAVIGAEGSWQGKSAWGKFYRVVDFV